MCSNKLVLEVKVLKMVPYSVRLTHLANTQNYMHDIKCTVITSFTDLVTLLGHN